MREMKGNVSTVIGEDVTKMSRFFLSPFFLSDPWNLCALCLHGGHSESIFPGLSVVSMLNISTDRPLRQLATAARDNEGQSK